MESQNDRVPEWKSPRMTESKNDGVPEWQSPRMTESQNDGVPDWDIEELKFITRHLNELIKLCSTATYLHIKHMIIKKINKIIHQLTLFKYFST